MKQEIYRALKLHDANFPEPKTIGICWTTDFKKAFPYGFKQHIDFYYVYTAIVDPSAIDQAATAAASSMFAYEREVVLFAGATIHIKAIEKITIQPATNKTGAWLYCYDHCRKNVNYKAKA